MICKSIPLPPFEDAKLDVICLSDSEELNHAPRPAIIVFPGGGYEFLSDREAEPIAIRFLAEGFATFILRYSIKPNTKGGAPLAEAALAILHLRQHAKEYHLDPDRVFVCGFSAGGHAAGALGVYWDTDPLAKILPAVDPALLCPTGMILSYPVITGGPLTHSGSLKNYFGTKEPSTEQIDFFSLEKHVTKNTPPTFLWHTYTDTTVPFQNTMLFADALTKAGVPFELHIFPAGKHGLSRADRETYCQREEYLVPHVANWLPLAIEWLKEF